MSDSDSFINEVSEELRRDQLFAFFRRWGWLFGLIVVALVGGAAFFELRRANDVAASQAFGDAVLQALEQETAEARQGDLAAITPESPGSEMLLALLLAGQEIETGDVSVAADRLREMAARQDLPERYRDLALLKAHLLSPTDPAEAAAMLDRLSRPGAPYRALAIEQQAYLRVAEGDIEGAQGILQELAGEAGLSLGLRQRIQQLIIALESGATLTDAPLPEQEAPGLALPVGELVPPATEDDGEDTAETPVEEDGAAPADETE